MIKCTWFVIKQKLYTLHRSLDFHSANVLR